MAAKQPRSKNAPPGATKNGTPSLTPTPRSRNVPHPSQQPDPRLPRNGRPNKASRATSGLPKSTDVWDETPTHMPPPRGDLDSAITPYRVWMHKLIRWSPIRQCTPDEVSRQLDQWYAGTLRYFALMMDAVANRDDVLQSVIPKRKASLSRRELICEPFEDADDQAEAQRHADCLTFFYDNLTATNCIDVNQKRGWRLLAEQMLDAVMKKYAVHEILWEPQSDGLTATFNFVPLWFFENRTGKLRFLQEDFSYDGVDMNDGAWMVTVGQGIMEAGVIAYMFKKSAMSDWLQYGQKLGMPGIIGRTKAGYGSDIWNALTKAVQDISNDFSVVVQGDKDSGDTIEKLDFSAAGTLPFPVMVERMDRVLAALMRGADLSSMSAHHTQSSSGGGQGASLQGKESHIVETDDANLVNETLNRCIDPIVIAYTFGQGVRPMARARIVVPPEQNVADDITIDTFLLDSGAELGTKETLMRYGRAPRDKADKPLIKPIPPPNTTLPNAPKKQGYMSNEANGNTDRMLLLKSDELFQGATYEALRPLVDRIIGVQEMPDDGFGYALHKLLADLPKIAVEINSNPANAKTLADSMSAGWFNSVISSAIGHHEARQSSPKEQ